MNSYRQLNLNNKDESDDDDDDDLDDDLDDEEGDDQVRPVVGSSRWLACLLYNQLSAVDLVYRTRIVSFLG